MASPGLSAGTPTLPHGTEHPTAFSAPDPKDFHGLPTKTTWPGSSQWGPHSWFQFLFSFAYCHCYEHHNQKWLEVRIQASEHACIFSALDCRCDVARHLELLPLWRTRGVGLSCGIAAKTALSPLSCPQHPQAVLQQQEWNLDMWRDSLGDSHTSHSALELVALQPSS